MKTDAKPATTTQATKSHAKIWLAIAAVGLVVYFFGFSDGDKPARGSYRSGVTHKTGYNRANRTNRMNRMRTNRAQPNRLTARQIQQLRAQQAYRLQQAQQMQQYRNIMALRRMQALQQQQQMMQGNGGMIHRGQGGTYGSDGKDFYISFGDGSSYMR